MNQLYFIVNSTAKAGGSMPIWKEIRAYLKNRHIRYQLFYTEYKGHATEIAERLSRLPDRAVYLIVIGGDGTINEVLNGITDFDKVRLGIIPGGSGNDFSRGMHLRSSLEGFEDILHSIQADATGCSLSRVDLGQVSWGSDHSRIFGISSGIGLDAIVCKKALTSPLKKYLNKLHLGQLTYVLLTIATLFSMKTANTTITTADGTVFHTDKLIFAAAMNLYAEGGGVPMAPKATPNDGLLSLSFAHSIPKAVTFLKLPLLMAARHEKLKGFTIINDSRIHLRVASPMVLHADGEYCGDVTSVTFTCLKNQLILLGYSRS